jgi:hypothetical protein
MKKLDAFIQSDNDALENRPLAKIYIVSLIVLALNYLIVFFFCVFTLNVYLIRRFVIQYPLCYTFAWW